MKRSLNEFEHQTDETIQERGFDYFKKGLESSAEQAEQLLDTLSHQALKTFIHNTCQMDTKFRQVFVTKHIHFLYPECKELYLQQLQALIKTYSNRHGFVDDLDARRLGRIVSEMAGEAMTDIENGKTQKAMFMALAIIEQMTDVLQDNVDDSDGQIEGSIEGAFAVLDALTQRNLNKTQHDELFACILYLFENDSMQGWDWQFTPIELGIKLVKTNQEKERIKSALDKIRLNERSGGWSYGRAQQLMLELIKKTEGHEAATRFMENNLSVSQFRVELIKRALHAKDYRKVESLASEGIARDEKEAPGMADTWRHYLLMAYQQIGEVSRVIQLARYFYIHSNGYDHPLKYYYDLLKSLVPPDRWQNYISALIKDIKNGNCRTDYNRISQLYIWELQWDKLFELLLQNASFERISEAEPYLADFYSNELATLYRKLILTYLERNMGREYYRTACRYIRRIINLGTRSMSADLVRELKVLYPTRRALLEELGKI